jgi:hypothetical protein
MEKYLKGLLFVCVCVYHLDFKDVKNLNIISGLLESPPLCCVHSNLQNHYHFYFIFFQNHTLAIFGVSLMNDKTIDKS